MSEHFPDEKWHTVSAQQMHEILQALSEDRRLRAILGGASLDSLTVALTDDGPIIEPVSGFPITDSDRRLLDQCVSEAKAKAASHSAPYPGTNVERERRDAGRPEPHLIAARSNLDAGNPGRALEVVEAALRRWPANTELHTYRALALAALGHVPQAAEAYQEVVRLDPGSVFAHTGAAQLLARAGKWEEALNYARSGVALSAGEPVLLHILALCEEHAGNYGDAQAAIERSAELAPDNPLIADDLIRIRRESAEDVDVSFVEDEPEPVPDEDIEVRLLSEEDEVAAEEPDPEPVASSTDARWAVATRHSESATHIECKACGESNPVRVTFCINCGNRMG